MKWALFIATILTGASLCACVALPPPTAPKTRVSADYEVIGEVSGVHAFVYGKRTVLEFRSRPVWLLIQDESGVTVPYEREGRYYRLARILDQFTVRASMRVLSFSSTSTRLRKLATDVPAPADSAAMDASVKEVGADAETPVMVSTAPASDEEADALFRLAVAQLNEVRRVIAAGDVGAAQARALTTRLDRIETRLSTAASVVIRVQFDRSGTTFAADERLVRTLVPAARAAQRIHVRGRTDSRIAGPDDARIALGRALAARQFLIEQGVDGSKIRVFARADGDFLAPPRTAAGRTLNRRVEIELMDHRYAALKQQLGRSQGTMP